jgi:hypothetical protein
MERRVSVMPTNGRESRYGIHTDQPTDRRIKGSGPLVDPSPTHPPKPPPNSRHRLLLLFSPLVIDLFFSPSDADSLLISFFLVCSGFKSGGSPLANAGAMIRSREHHACFSLNSDDSYLFRGRHQQPPRILAY